jgi:magnesium transporter
MSKHHRRRSKKAGLPPGTMVHIGEQKIDKVGLSVLAYNADRVVDKPVHHLEECLPLAPGEAGVNWLNVEGLHEVAEIERIGNFLKLHPLTLEDIVNTLQRPKFEDFGEYQFLVLKMLSFDAVNQEMQAEQVSLVFGRDYVVTFQEGAKGDVFQPVRDRIRNPLSRIRKLGSDYLAYALIDVIVDNYFLILERMSETIEELEDELVTVPDQDTLQQIHRLKRELLVLRKATWPLRELVSAMQRSESDLIQQGTRVFLRDLYDHVIQVIDTVETFREMLSGMLDIYLSSVSNRMNAVMKVLTVIATVFMPLTFIAGVYGMNFQYMPELGSRWGYPGVLMGMVAVGTGMLLWFRRRRWL